jgi:taurine dioxygenase
MTAADLTTTDPMSKPMPDQPRDQAAAVKASRRQLPNSIVMNGPCTYLADERQRLHGLRYDHFEVRQLGATVGGEIHGVDLTEVLPDEVIAEIRRALHDYKVIFFRDQAITIDQHVAFAARFGTLETHPFLPPNAEQPELVRFNKNANAAGYENGWHHDVTWRAEPSMGAVLHAISVPPVGGDTLFADMYAAYDGLPDDVRARVDTLQAEHDFMQAFGHNLSDADRAETRERFPVVHHPVAPRHDVTGRRYLYINRYFTTKIIGLEKADSDELIEYLARQADYPEYQCRYTWRNDSVAFWDNRAVQHYAASDYWPEVRIMERASIVGSRPSS